MSDDAQRDDERRTERLFARLRDLETEVQEVHDFFFKPPVEGRPNRVAQIDDLLFAARAGKAAVRGVLWLASALAILAAGTAALQGWGLP